jgi:hypothetical protein
MTTTEQRLRDALSAQAAQVRDDRLRPLPESAAAPAAPAARAAPGAERWARRRQAWRNWLIPLAAAASVLLIVGLGVAVTRFPTHSQPVASQPGTPSYFVSIAGTGPGNRIDVQSVSTGAVTATVQPPKAPPGAAVDYEALAAAPDDRTFYVEYQVIPGNPNAKQIWIFSFSLTRSGSATPLTMVKGGRINNQPGGQQKWGNLAVSPDGTKLAFTVDSSHVDNQSPGYSDEIIAIDLRTGVQEVWMGGLYRSGKQFSILDVSWTADGRSLVFLGQWCDAVASRRCDGTSAPSGYRDAQVWSLSLAAGGGSLSDGQQLLRQSARYPVIAQALGAPDGSDLTLAVLSGQPDGNGRWPQLTVEQVSADGSGRSVDYRISRAQGLGGSPRQVWLSADPSGQHLLLAYAVDGGFVIGWLANGTFHRLPFPQPYLPSDATIVIAW